MIDRLFTWIYSKIEIGRIAWLGGVRVSVPYLTDFSFDAVGEVDDITPQEFTFESVLMTKEVFEHRLEKGTLNE